MPIGLGIDTGGTYTDAVLFDYDSQLVLASAKALTTWPDLTMGIGQAVQDVLSGRPTAVDMVSLSTTLATNALVEGRGMPVALLLIGYDPDLVEGWGFRKELSTPHVAYIAGGRRGNGREAHPLDRAAVAAAVDRYQDQVEAFAVSAYFSVRNPAHELEAKAIIRDRCPKPVTCGHELTGRLNSIRRATTVALNARLIPLLNDLIVAVEATLQRLGIAAPLMVVKGDGSLMNGAMALERPIETTLSGPAAGVVGAQFLAGGQEMVVVDMGGTTTDVALVQGGRPQLSTEGAWVGGWRTMVEAVEARTVGLGGDSRVSIDREGRLQVGPQRVVPLSLAAMQYETILPELERQSRMDLVDDLAGQFLLPHRNGQSAQRSQSAPTLEILQEQGPRSVAQLVAAHGRPYGLYLRQLESLEEQGLVIRSAFTPTDALHALDQMNLWQSDAARLGARLAAGPLGMESKAFCEEVVRRTSLAVARGVVSTMLHHSGGLSLDEGNGLADRLIRAGLEPERAGLTRLNLHLGLRVPLVAIGAPVEAYLPAAANRLGAGLQIPPYAACANALGAVVGSVMQTVRALIVPEDGGTCFRLHLGDTLETFLDLEEAVDRATLLARELAATRARESGASSVELEVTRQDHKVQVATGWGEEILLETEVLVTAMGRPAAVGSTFLST